MTAAAISLVAGALAAVPVAAVLGGGIALGHPVPAVTMGAGAMLVGIAWRSSGGRPPLALMATDAVVMGLATFAGCITGSIAWLHLVLIFVWALAAGLLVCLGTRGAVVGTQAMIAVVVFGRFSEPLAPALGLAASVLAGGLAQVLFQSVVRYPRPLSVQRQSTAAAYRILAGIAVTSPEISSLPAGAAPGTGRGQPGFARPVRRLSGGDATQPGQRGLPHPATAEHHPPSDRTAAERRR